MTKNVGIDKLWVEKYRPRTVEDYVFHDAQLKASVMQWIEKKTVPHLLLSGVHGTGKTTLAQILIRALELDEMDVLTINAADERGISTFRTDIKDFSATIPFGEFKIIHLEEADSLTPDAQRALKSFMEEVSETVRFIMTCNHVNKIIPEIRSRCQEFFFRASEHDDIVVFAIKVLGAERVKFDLDLVDKYVAAGYPDIRKITNTLQQNTVNNVLQPPKHSGGVTDYQFKLLDLIEKDDWSGARTTLCTSISPDQWENVYRFLYENIHRSAKFASKQAWEEAIITIAEHLYKHSIVADPEINAAAMLIRLGSIK